MKVRLFQPPHRMGEAGGLAVVIDVFRAFSTACYAVANGAERIIPVSSEASAHALKEADPHFILIGERGGAKLPGADYGNSPSEIEHVDFSGLTIVQATSAGTKGFSVSPSAQGHVTGSLVNAKAIARYIRRRQPTEVSLMCMGLRAEQPCDEDTLCAEYILSCLDGQEMPEQLVRDRLRAATSAAKFFDEAVAWAPERDFALCADLNRFDFVLQLNLTAEPAPALIRTAV